MDLELKTAIDALGTTFGEFKTAVETQITELKKGVKDPLVEEQIKKLNDKLDVLQEQKDAIEKKLNRPQLGGDAEADERKTVDEFNRQRRCYAQEKGFNPPADATIEEVKAYKGAFINVVRKGANNLTADERKAMSVGVDNEGGVLVPPDTTGRITTKLFELSPIRGIANVQQIGSDRLEGFEDLDEAAAGWVGELEARADTATPKVGAYEIPVHEMYAQPKTSQRLLDDAAIDVEAWLSGKVVDKLARLEGAAFCTGNGVKKPRGFCSYPFAATADATRAWGTMEKIKTGVNAAFAAASPADILFDLEAAFKPGYLAGASWVTKRAVLALIRKMKGAATGDYLWQPGLQQGRPAMLISYPYVLAEDLPLLSANSTSMFLGNFNLGYQIVDRLGIRVLRDPYTDKPYIKFYTTKRTGGGVVNFEAIKAIEFAA